MSGPDWQAGRLAIFIVWDEGFGPTPPYGADCTVSTLGGCHIPLVVISPGTSHVADPALYTTYSLLRTTEELLGLPLLGRAATALSMRDSFGLGAAASSTTFSTVTLPPTTPPTTSTTPPSTTTTVAGADTTPPTGSITSPVNGATVSGTATVSLSAADNVGVVQINLLVDGVFFASITKAPYNLQLNTTNYPNGSHSLYAKIYDAAGNKTVTSTVPITIQN